MRHIALTQGKWSVELAPEIGGSISRCDYDGQPILRPGARGDGTGLEARDMSCYPLVPFSNRIEHGLFEFGGRKVQLPRNMGDHPHPLHGQGWRGVWTVEEEGPDSARIAYDHPADSWPWHYRAWQNFALADDRLTVTLGARNLSDSPMPVGLGLHPYFPAPAGTMLTTGITHLWECTSQQIPIRYVDLPPEFTFADGLRIADHDLDHCFAGWNRTARIDWPGRPYRVNMQVGPSARHFILYTPAGQDFFCAEGVENMNNAINWQDRGVFTGLTILPPGASHELETVFRVEPASA